jgi:hypothetical protein
MPAGETLFRMNDVRGARGARVEWRAVLLATALVPMLSTCGSSGGGSCGKVAPCGGDITGNWTITDACVSNSALMAQLTQLIPNCTTATATATGVHATGSASFNADMTYTVTETLSASGQAKIPPECVQVAGLTLSCDQVDQLVQGILATNPMGVQSAHCSGSGTCTCDVTLAPTTTNEMGTYTTSGTTLTTTTNTGTVNTVSYCVQKNELHMTVVNPTMPTDAMGHVNTDADTVFKKQ